MVAVTGTWLGSLAFAASNFRRQFREDDHAKVNVHCLLFGYRAKTGE